MVNLIIFSWILQIWYVEVRISRSISESHLEFEITTVNCINLLNLSWIIKCLFLRNMEPLRVRFYSSIFLLTIPRRFFFCNCVRASFISYVAFVFVCFSSLLFGACWKLSFVWLFSGYSHLLFSLITQTYKYKLVSALSHNGIWACWYIPSITERIDAKTLWSLGTLLRPSHRLIIQITSVWNCKTECRITYQRNNNLRFLLMASSDLWIQATLMNEFSVCTL